MWVKEICHYRYLVNLKECCDLAGIKEITTKLHSTGTKRTELFKPKNQLITAHTSRKTFMTLCNSFEVPENTITSMTGHKTGNQTVEIYLKVDETTKLRQMDEAWKKLYQAPGTEDPERTELEKLKKEIEELKKIIELQNADKKISPSD